MNNPPASKPRLKLTVVTGLSGSGISTAINALEDLGYFCIDNLPPALLPKLVELGNRVERFERLALGLDVRNVKDVEGTLALLDRLQASGLLIEFLFLEAGEDVILRRFSVSRRPHPLSFDGLPITEAIRTERLVMHPFRERATYLIDTSDLNVHECKQRVQSVARGHSPRGLFLSVISFGFRYGVPTEADIVWDVRFLKNPHFVEELRPKTGMDTDVQEYVLAQTQTQQFLAAFFPLIDQVLPAYEKEGKSHLTIAIGCTGGKHRSVSLVETLAKHLRIGGHQPKIRHRDMGKERQ